MFLHFFVILAMVAAVVRSDSNMTEIEGGNSLQKEPLSLKVHKKIYSYTKNAQYFKNMTFEQTMDFFNDLYAWEAPDDIKENFPYALWGYDFDRRPVWIHEVGRQNWRGIVEQGPERTATLEKYFVKCLIHVVQSLAASDLPGDEIRHGVFIWDLEGFSMRQILHLPTVRALVGWAVKYGDLPLELVNKVFIVNSNYATKLAADIARPLLGRLLEMVEIYGTNQNTWLPKILKSVPKEILPPWYGGYQDTKPKMVYG